MKFILYDSPEYFTDIKKTELVKCVFTPKEALVNSEEDTIASSLKYNHPSPELDHTIVSHDVIERSKEEKQTWDYQKGEYVPTGEFFDIIHLRIEYSVKVETIEIDSAEELYTLSEQIGSPIIVNYGSSRGEYEYPSIHVYDDYI